MATNRDGTKRTRTQLAHDAYEVVEQAAFAKYQAVIREEFPVGTRVAWSLRMGKPKMWGVVTELPRFRWDGKVRVKARTGTPYTVDAQQLEVLP